MDWGWLWRDLLRPKCPALITKMAAVVLNTSHMSQAHTTSMSPMEANQSLVSIFASYASISLFRFNFCLSIFFLLEFIYLVCFYFYCMYFLINFFLIKSFVFYFLYLFFFLHRKPLLCTCPRYGWRNQSEMPGSGAWKQRACQHPTGLFCGCKQGWSGSLAGQSAGTQRWDRDSINLVYLAFFFSPSIE